MSDVVDITREIVAEVLFCSAFVLDALSRMVRPDEVRELR